jgi:hypothetical protein
LDSIFTIGLLLAGICAVPAALWYTDAARDWVRVAFPEARPGPIGDVLEAGARMRALSHPSSDPSVERLRILAHRRWNIVFALITGILYDPALVVIAAVTLMRATQVGIVAVGIVVFELALTVAAIIHVARRLVAYGNGAPVRRGWFVPLIGRIVVLAMVMVVQTAVLSR